MKKLIAAKSKVKFIDTFRKCFHLVRALPSAHKLPVWLCLPGGVATRVMADTGGQKDDCHNWSQPFCAAASSLPFAVKTFDHFSRSRGGICWSSRQPHFLGWSL